MTPNPILNEQMDWAVLSTRIDGPKLRWLQDQLAKEQIPSRVIGHGFHGPILQVPAESILVALGILYMPIGELMVEAGTRFITWDDLPDNHDSFIRANETAKFEDFRPSDEDSINIVSSIMTSVMADTFHLKEESAEKTIQTIEVKPTGGSISMETSTKGDEYLEKLGAEIFRLTVEAQKLADSENDFDFDGEDAKAKICNLDSFFKGDDRKIVWFTCSIESTVLHRIGFEAFPDMFDKNDSGTTEVAYQLYATFQDRERNPKGTYRYRGQKLTARTVVSLLLELWNCRFGLPTGIGEFSVSKLFNQTVKSLATNKDGVICERKLPEQEGVPLQWQVVEPKAKTEKKDGDKSK